MKILIVTQYFWPETFIINDLAKTLSRLGHDVVVATGKPNYPDGYVFRGYTAGGVLSERYVDDVQVLRAPLRPRKSGGTRNLLLNYLSFAISGSWFFPKLTAGRSFDVVLSFIPSPITGSIPAIVLKWRTKAHLAIWIQDLWPESLVATGFIKNRLLLRLIGWMVRSIYGCADTLLVQSEAFRAPVARYACVDKIVYYPNSIAKLAATQGKQPLPADLVRLLDLYFCVVFAGNIGSAQAVETLVAAAFELQDLTDCKIVLVGSGSMLDWVRERKTALELDNLVLAGRYPMETMPHIFEQASALVVTLKNEPIFSYTIPSKVQAYLAAGKPIIAALNGEGARVVKEAGAGLSCAAEDAGALAQCVRELYALPRSERERMGAAGYAYFLEHFEMTRQARRLVKILEWRMAHAQGEG